MAFFTASAVAVPVITVPALAAPQPDLWERWQKHGDGAAVDAAVDHAPWGEFLSEYGTAERDGVALVDYAGVSPAGRRLLDGYLASLAAAPIDEMTRDEQRAFWINLYNALTVDVILDNYPVESIRDISEGFFAAGPWDIKLFSIRTASGGGGEELSLNDIEHRILRPIWKDARLHYAVNCASIGCPNIAAVPFTAENTEEMLNAGAVAYINNARGAQVKDGRLIVSSIYEWFKDDFGGNDAGVIAHLRKYAQQMLKEELAGVSKISSDEYNWSLNEK